MTQHKVYMNQIHGSSLLCELAQMWRNQALCDAIIKAGASTARAHRLVLVAACPMLKSMEGASVGSHLEVRLASDIKEDSIHTFLQYLYEGCMVLTEDNYKDIEKIGRILQVDSVIKCCSDFYKCLNSSSQYKYDYYDHVEFKHVRQTDMLKFSEKSNKRPTDSKSTSQSGKRQKIQNSDSSFFSATSKNDDRSSSSNLKDSVRPYKMGPASVSRRTNGSMDVVEDGVQIHHVDKDSSSGTSQVVDASSAMSVSVASQIQSDVNVQVVNVMNTQSTSSPAGVPRIPTKPPLSGPFPTESPDNRSDSPLFLSRNFGSSVVPPSKSFAMGSPTMVPVGPAQFPTFVKESSATVGTEDDVGMKSRSESRSSLMTTSPDPSIVKKEPGTSTPGTSTPYVEVQEQGMMMLRRPDTDSEPQEEVSSDLEIEEPPPDDSYAGDPGSEASWMAGQAGCRKTQGHVQTQNETSLSLSLPFYKHGTKKPKISPSLSIEPHGSQPISSEPRIGQPIRIEPHIGQPISSEPYVGQPISSEQYPGGTGPLDSNRLEVTQSDISCFGDTKEFYMTDEEGIVHRLVGNPGHKALTCAYCKLLGNKTACGWHIKCYYRCNVCNVPLCNIKRDCFIQFHTKLKTQQIQTLINPVCAIIQGTNS